MTPAEKSPDGTAGTTLEELERFRQDIERYRARRKAVAEEFEGFVRGFKQPAAAAPAAAPRPAAPPPPVVAKAPAPPPAPPVDATPPPAVAAPAPEPRRPAIEPDLEQPAAPRRSWTPLIAAALVILAVAAWWLTRTPSGTPEAPPATAAAPVTTPQPAAPSPPPAPPVDPSQSVLTTTRAVWLRVMADGNRVLSRELPAGARVPFKAEKVIEIRAGDAGAVRLSIGGKDQGALGADGAVVTRTFNVPR